VYLTSQMIVYGLCRVSYPLDQATVSADCAMRAVRWLGEWMPLLTS
jgi:hypothetical protein